MQLREGKKLHKWPQGQIGHWVKNIPSNFIKITNNFKGNYEKMEEYIQMINENTQEGSFMRAVMAIRNNEFGMAQDYINKVFTFGYYLIGGKNIENGEKITMVYNG